MHESQKETGLCLVEAGYGHAKAGSRGSSILAGIVMVAMFGSAAAAFESLIPFGSDPSQLTASSLAALPTTTAIPESRTKDDLVVKDDISPTTLPYPPYQTVRYACTQSGSADNIKTLTQKCQPGFAYVISESKTGVMVTPRRFPGDASTLCPSSALGSATCSNKSKPILSCATGIPAPCHVGYCVTVPPTPATPTGQKCESAGEVAPGGELAISDRRVAGLTEVLKNENTESRTEILNSTAGLSAPEQDALSRALTGSGLADAPQEIQSGRDDVAARIKALATCPYGVCDAEKVALADRDAELARQQKFIQDLRAMGGAQGLSPDDRTGTKLSEPTYVPDAVAGDTTFGGSTMPPPSKLPLNPEQSANKSNPSFGEAITGSLKKGVTAVGTAVSNLAEKVKEAYKSTVSGVGELFKGPQFTQNTDPTPLGITESVKNSSGGTYDQARANDAATARLNGLAAQKIHDDLIQEHPEVRGDAEGIVASTKGDMGKRLNFLNTLATAADTDSSEAPKSSGLSSSEEYKLDIQEKLIDAPCYSKVSIQDNFKCAGLPDTKAGRRDVADALRLAEFTPDEGGCKGTGTHEDKAGDYDFNLCMKKAVETFQQKGVITTVTRNRVITIDSNGKILSDVPDVPITSTQSRTTLSLAAGKTPKQIEAYKALLASGEDKTIRADDIVYKTELPVTIRCIDSFGGSVSNSACNKMYSKAGVGVSLQDKSLSGLLGQIQDTNGSPAATRYVLADQTVVGEERGRAEWVVDGGASEYNTQLLQRKVGGVTDAKGNVDLTKIAVPYEQLPASVRKQFVPTVGAIQAPAVAKTNSAPTSFPASSPIESVNRAQMDAAETARLQGVADRIQAQANAEEVARLKVRADEASRNEVIRTTDSVLAQVKTARMEEKQATIEADTTSGLAAYAALQAEQRARADKATSERLYGQASSYALKNIDTKLGVLGEIPGTDPTNASDYKSQLASHVQDIKTDGGTQTDIYKYLSEADKQLSDEITARQIARGNEAYAARVAGFGMDTYIRQNPTVTGIEHAMLVAGQSDSQISAYVDTLASDGRKNSKTAAEADAYLNYNYQSVLKYTDQQIANGQSTLGLPAPSRASGSGVQVASLQTPGVIGLNADEVDAHIKGTFERARANVQEQINAAGGYLDLGKTVGIGTEVQAFQDDLKRQLAIIDKNYADYKAGNPSPALQQVITRLGQGDVNGGGGWGALASVKQGTDADRVGFEQTMATDQSGWYAVPAGIAWLTGQVVGGAADGSKNILSKLNVGGLTVPGFKPDVQTQLLDAVDPYGVGMRTVGDVVNASPVLVGVGYGTVRAVGSGIRRLNNAFDPYGGLAPTISRGASSISTRIEPPRLLQPSPVQPIRPPVPLPVVTSPRSISVVPPRTVPMDSSPASSVYFDARPGVMRWRNAETGRFASAPASSASSPIDFSKININPAPGPVNSGIFRTDAVTRLLNDIRSGNPTVLPPANDNFLPGVSQMEDLNAWLRSLTQ